MVGYGVGACVGFGVLNLFVGGGVGGGDGDGVGGGVINATRASLDFLIVELNRFKIRIPGAFRMDKTLFCSSKIRSRTEIRLTFEHGQKFEPVVAAGCD